MDTVHYSVMTEEVLEYLAPKTENALLIDATLGEGGHSEKFLSTFPGLRVVGIDADEQILEKAKQRLAPYGDRFRGYNSWFNVFFREYPLGGEQPDLILFDLGISMYHYERGERGFTFQKDEPLDMRLNGNLEIAAMDIVNTYPEEELREIISEYGEERYAGSIARAICREREKGEIRTSAALASVIRSTVPPKYRYGSIHPATRTFQAIRIMVNGELVRLEAALSNSLQVLKVGGRIGVISFHSLEDRIVKRFFREKNKDCTCPPDWPICKCGGKRVVDILTKKPLRPTEEEVNKNPPSRSAKFRVVEKLRDEER
ncbi:MAG: 16S rRNA (cytosine(1402)-N(4))-methyltransferase RsmH [Spirochaetaceae bacterium]